MYLWGERYDVAVAFIDGFDLACEGGVLIGLREWLVPKVGSGNNIVWGGLVLDLAFPTAESPTAELEKDGGHKRAVEFLFALLREF